MLTYAVKQVHFAKSEAIFMKLKDAGFGTQLTGFTGTLLAQKHKY
jgi:hypothetical protein